MTDSADQQPTALWLACLEGFSSAMAAGFMLPVCVATQPLEAPSDPVSLLGVCRPEVAFGEKLNLKAMFFDEIDQGIISSQQTYRTVEESQGGHVQFALPLHV